MKAVAVACAVAALIGISGCKLVDSPTNRVGIHIALIDNKIPTPGESLEAYCSAYNPEPEMHRYTIRQLVDAHKPFILVFGTPAHCTQCQNQIDTVKYYYNKYNHAFEVVHIDEYKNADVYTQMGVKGDPWTFLVDAKGIIRNVYPGVTTWDHLDTAIEHMIHGDYPEQGTPS